MLGDRGENGDKGDLGPKGDFGEAGEKGGFGELGYKGEKGLYLEYTIFDHLMNNLFFSRFTWSTRSKSKWKLSVTPGKIFSVYFFTRNSKFQRSIELLSKNTQQKQSKPFQFTLLRIRI